MIRHLFTALLAIQLIGLGAAPAHAHFLWLLRIAEPNPSVQLYFSEAAEPGDADLLKLVAKSKASSVVDGKATALNLSLTASELAAPLKESDPDTIFVARHRYGVLDRGDAPFLLEYYAKTGPELGSAAWDNPLEAERLALDIHPSRNGSTVSLMVRWQGKPVTGAEVKVEGGSLEDFSAETNDQGKVELTAESSGLYSIRARYVEDKAGSLDGKDYASIKHYSTLALRISSTEPEAAKPGESFSDIPEDVTSFGAAVMSDAIYLYGGHTGLAHAYDNESQGNTLYRLSRKPGAKWEAIAEGPRLQGLAMVALDDKLYRLGGFTARNAPGEEHDLHSQHAAERFDPTTKKWEALPKLPEPRSSFDAAVLDGKIYIVGGWALRGEDDSQWHKTAYVLDPGNPKAEWTALPEPPFQRRALSAAAFDGKLFAIGGMQPKGGPTTAVAVFDPATDKWSEGPALPGKPMEGFGSSAFATGGRLYVTTISGQLLRLSEEQDRWEKVAVLERARFFHRMLPLDDSHLLMLGGANMGEGKFSAVDVIEVD